MKGGLAENHYTGYLENPWMVHEICDPRNQGNSDLLTFMDNMLLTELKLNIKDDFPPSM